MSDDHPHVPGLQSDLNDVGFIEGTTSRQPLDPQALKGMGAAVAISAFSSVRFLMKALQCTEAEARQFKINAQHDFEYATAAARRALGKQAW
jgi:hypothetical protein